MKKCSLLLFVLMMLLTVNLSAVQAQCSICTKTAAQLGEKPARSLNSGIVYLMLTPFAIVGVIGYKWWKNEKANNAGAE